jgi:hypothetical protein
MDLDNVVGKLIGGSIRYKAAKKEPRKVCD